MCIPHHRWDIFVYYAGLGLGAALPIGPVNVEMARRTLRMGFRAGFALGCGAVCVDMTYAVLSSLSVAKLVSRPSIQWTVGIAGFVLLVFLGVQSLRSAKTHLKDDPLAEVSTKGSASGSFRTGVLMTLLNPITLIFWFVEVPAHGPITEGTPGNLPMMCSGVFIGTCGWVLGFTSILTTLGRWRQRWWLAAADRIGGIMLLVLAVYGLWHLIAHSL